MRVKIHRGAHEIGGSCVEVEAAGVRVVLDVGRPLTAKRDEEAPLPPVLGFISPDPSLLGVLITHGHQDHWGLVDQLPQDVPVFIGEAAGRILSEAAFWTTGTTIRAAGYFEHRKTFEFGPFRITPFLNDHSAFDAYSLLVEAEGRRLFYTGDIRAHGHKKAIFRELLRKPPQDVNALLLEGTHVLPEDGPLEEEPSEADVEAACVETFKSLKGIALVIHSAQNIDRLVTLYRAAIRSGRDFVMDLYGASIARGTENPNIPKPGPEWPRVRVYVPRWQRVKVKQGAAFERVAAIKPFRVFEENLAADPSRYVLTFSVSSGRDLERAGTLAGAGAVWSLWSGYLKEPSGERLQSFLKEHGIPLAVHHSSGHAYIKDLQELARAMNADRVVPIHSFGGTRFSEFFSPVDLQPDGSWWVV